MLSFSLGFLFTLRVLQRDFPAQDPSSKVALLFCALPLRALCSPPVGQEELALLQHQGTERRWGIAQEPIPAPSQVQPEGVCGSKIMGEKQSHSATAPHRFSLAERLGTAGLSSLGPVSGLMSYVLPCKCGQLFSPLRASGSSAESESYYETMTCFFCLPFVFLVPLASLGQWHLSLGTLRACFLVTKRQDLIGPGYSLVFHLVITALKWDLTAVF